MQRTGPIVYIWTLFNLLLYTKMTAFQKLLSDKRRVVITRKKSYASETFRRCHDIKVWTLKMEWAASSAPVVIEAYTDPLFFCHVHRYFVAQPTFPKQNIAHFWRNIDKTA